LDPDELCISKALRSVRESSKKAGKRASKRVAKWAERSEEAVLKMRSFSQPNEQTLENFEKTFMISEIMATGANQQQMETEVRICCVIQVKMWPLENRVPLSTTSLIELIKMTRSWRKRAPDRPDTKPTIVMSHNGVSRCGIFVAANVCIDQMDMDFEVDVFHAVKMIRINRPQLIDMKDEYKYLYDLMLHWYMTNPEYRKNEPEESKRLDTEIIEDFEDEETEQESTHESTGAFARLQRSFRRASSKTRSRANSTMPSPIQAPQPLQTSTPVQVLPSPVTPTTNSTQVPNNVQANGGRRTPSKSPRQTVYLND